MYRIPYERSLPPECKNCNTLLTAIGPANCKRLEKVASIPAIIKLIPIYFLNDFKSLVG
jgi:hypothetical protein